RYQLSVAFSKTTWTTWFANRLRVFWISVSTRFNIPQKRRLKIPSGVLAEAYKAPVENSPECRRPSSKDRSQAAFVAAFFERQADGQTGGVYEYTRSEESRLECVRDRGAARARPQDRAEVSVEPAAAGISAAAASALQD